MVGHQPASDGKPHAIGLRTNRMPDVTTTLNRLDREAILQQLAARSGRMAELGTEDGDLKLDWVDGVAGAIAHPERLRAVAEEVCSILEQGIRRVIWAGMGGSVQTVYSLRRMGFLTVDGVSIHPLDSTDPAALTRTIEEIATLEGLAAADLPRDSTLLRKLLDTTMMIGVSMGMTSEEPITHLEWFDRLLQSAGVPDLGAHIQVMTLPDSYLDRFARAHGSRMVPIQLDGANHTPGRMSAPATRVFLRPVAFALAARNGRDPSRTAASLTAILQRAQLLALPGGFAGRPSDNPFVRFGAIVAHETEYEGRNKVLVHCSYPWIGLVPWLEQLVEESLGKGGKGFLIFSPQDTARLALRDDVMALYLEPEGTPGSEPRYAIPDATLTLPVDPAIEPNELAEAAGLMLGFEFAVATFGYLHGIVFAGQPGVEAYKRYARELRDAPRPVPLEGEGDLCATADGLIVDATALERARLASWSDAERAAAAGGWDLEDPAGILASVLSLARSAGWFRYLDVTFNGDLTPVGRAALSTARRALALDALGVPCKLRTGPSDYHSTEQSETDGPYELVSLRIVARRHAAPLVGEYDPTFLLAQARGTVQAMEDAGRWVVFIILADGSDDRLRELARLFDQTAQLLRRPAN